MPSQRRKCRHFDKIFIIGCTGSCHFDNFQCSQWWKLHKNEDIPVSVMATRLYYWPFMRGIHCSPVDSTTIMRSFEYFFAASMSKFLNKQPSCRWFETSWRSHDILVMHFNSLNKLLINAWHLVFRGTDDLFSRKISTVAKTALYPYKWRHNECDGVSNQRRLDFCSTEDQRKHQSHNDDAIMHNNIPFHTPEWYLIRM